jgi:hypothetical protein
MAKTKLMTQKEFAEHIGKTPQYVNKLVNEGKIQLVRKDGKKLVDPKQAQAAMVAFSKVGKVVKSPKKKTAAKPKSPGPAKPRKAAVEKVPRDSATRQLTKFRTEREEIEAKTARLKYDVLRKALLPADDVREAERMKNQNIRQKFHDFPRANAETCARLTSPAECEHFLRQAIYKIFEKLEVDPLGMKPTYGAGPEVLPADVQTFATNAGGDAVTV